MLRVVFLFFFFITSLQAVAFRSPIDVSLPGATSDVPQIAFGVGGNAIAVWASQGATTLIIQASTTLDDGATWQTPVGLSVTGAESPQIAFGVGGNAIAVWARSDGTNLIVQASRTLDGGATWQTPVDLSAAGAEAAQIAFGVGGNAIAIWTRSNGTNQIIQISRTLDGGATWQTPVDLSFPGNDSITPQIAFGVGGNAIAVWARSNGTNFIIQASRTLDSGATWQTPIDISLPGNNAFDPQIAFDVNGNAIAIWTRSNGTNQIIQASRTLDSGATWQTPIDLSLPGNDAFTPQIAFGVDGNAIAVWRRFDGTNQIIQASRTLDDGATWQTPIDISLPGNDALDPQISFGIGENAIAIWTRSNGTNQIIQASSTSDGGGSWQIPIDVSLPGGDASVPQIAFGSDGNAIAVWIRSNGTNNIVQASSSFLPSPSPFSFSASGKQFKVNSLFQKDFVNEISWNSIPSAVNYNVFNSNFQLLFQGTALSFFDHDKKKGVSYTYFVTWTDSLGVQSSPVTVTVP